MTGAENNEILAPSKVAVVTGAAMGIGLAAVGKRFRLPQRRASPAL